MYLSFLLLIAVIYNRVSLLCRVKQLAIDDSETPTKVPDCFFREHSLICFAITYCKTLIFQLRVVYPCSKESFECQC